MYFQISQFSRRDGCLTNQMSRFWSWLLFIFTNLVPFYRLHLIIWDLNELMDVFKLINRLYLYKNI
jgi:hypothetical protein